MRKQFKKGVAILSAVSMVAAGMSYVPQNVKADAPVIAVQDSEEGVDYSSLTYTKAEPNGGGEFPELYYSVITDELHANVGYFDAGATFQFAYSADNKQEDTKITVNGVETEPGAGVVSMYISGLTKLNPKAMEDNAYTHVVITSTTGKLEIVFKKGTPASSGTTTTTTTEPTTTTTEPTTTTTTTTTTTEAPEVTTPAKVPGLTYAGNETLPFYFAWQSVAGANGYNVYLDGKLITKVDGVTYEFSKDLFAEAREYIIAVAAVNEAGEGTKTEYKYTVESKEPDSTKNEETDSTKNEETDSTKNEESNSSSSTEENVKVPVAVTGLAYTGTEEASFKFSWDASKGAESYNVYLNDKFVTSTVTPEYSFDSALFEKAGTYTISVEAVNKAGKSDKTSIEYVVKEPASSESTDESKGDNTEVTMPSDYTAFENNADFGYKFVSAPEAAKAEVKTDQGENLFIAFNAVEGFLPDYTGLKVNGTDRDVSKGTGITLPKSLLTKKVNEVVILDKDGKEVVLNVFNVNGEGEIPTSPSVTEPDASTPDVSTPDASTPDASTPDVSTPDASTPDASTPDVSTPDVSTPDVSTPDASTPDVTQPDVTTPDAITTSTDVTSPDATSADVTSADVTTPDVTTPDSGKDESTAKPTVKPTTPKVTTAKPTVKPTTAKPTTKKASLKKTKITKKITKKLSSKKVKLTFKKVKGAKKYTVQVSTSKKFKKVLYKKTVKKTKVTLSSKKFKGKKKLYVRVKAVGAKKWSKVVKIKVKK
mgnify:CR=1 FL=1